MVEEWVCRECGSVNSLDTLRCDCGYAGDVPVHGPRAVTCYGEVQTIPHPNDIEMLRRAEQIKKMPRGDKTPGQMAKELAAQWRGE